MVLSITAFDTAGDVHNLILGRTNLWVGFVIGICGNLEQISAIRLCILAGADGDNENVNSCGKGDSEGDGDGNGNSTERMLAMTMLASKLAQTESILYTNALETQFSISIHIPVEMLHVWHYGSHNNGSEIFSQLESSLCSSQTTMRILNISWMGQCKMLLINIFASAKPISCKTDWIVWTPSGM